MTFRGRLRLFFTIIVIVPMTAVALVLFTLTAESDNGKTDARIAAGLRNAFALYDRDSNAARPALRAAAADPSLRRALLDGSRSAARARLATLGKEQPSIVNVELGGPGGHLLARAGSRRGIAAASARLTTRNGKQLGTLSVSVTTARRFVREVHRLSGLGITVFRGRRRLASTIRGLAGDPERGAPDKSREFKARGRDYRGRLDRIREPIGPPTEIAVFRRSDELGDGIFSTRLVIGAVLLFLLALALSELVARALQGQIAKFLAAARRLGQGDFDQRVPTEGSDEFAALGREFNSMSAQLAAKIDEVERKRAELEETIRRVGEAFASGLDRQGVVELAVATAVDACEAEAGRALPVGDHPFLETRTGASDSALTAALEAAEDRAVGERRKDRRTAEASVDRAHALAAPMRARIGSQGASRNVGVISIARRGDAFSRSEEELLEYLAGQAGVSIENADLHERVQRQAVTDELTGLSNVRQLHSTLDREIERSKRFRSPLGLVMLDIDDFKQVNDEFGHQQGDEVLAAVAGVLRHVSRDIDEPARYGGEELAVVLPETESDGAAHLAERMREAVEDMRVARVDGPGELAITASFGVASVPETAQDKASLIAAADAALYRAKRSGKNRVERADPVPASR